MSVARVADLVESPAEERGFFRIGDVELDDARVPVRDVGGRALIGVTDAVRVDGGEERVHPLEGADDGITAEGGQIAVADDAPRGDTDRVARTRDVDDAELAATRARLLDSSRSAAA